MMTRATVEIAAEARQVWEIFSNVLEWPTWTESVTSVRPLDGPEIAAGNRFEIRQPKLPTLVWEVTAVDAPRSWTWVVRRPGATTSATHDVSPLGAGCVVTQVIEHRGPLGVVAGALTRRLTRHYLAVEGAGLKAVSESARRSAPKS